MSERLSIHREKTCFKIASAFINLIKKYIKLNKEKNYQSKKGG